MSKKILDRAAKTVLKAESLNLGKPCAVTLSGDLSPTGRLIEVYPFPSMEEIKDANRAAGLYWFTPETMGFFKSYTKKHLGKGVFVSSETNPAGTQYFTVRVADSVGNIETFGTFPGFEDSLDATVMAKTLKDLLSLGFYVSDGFGKTFFLSK